MTDAIGITIRIARHHAGYSQYRLADELVAVSGNTAVTREQVARWERGKRIPGPYWRQWLAIALGVSRRNLDAAAHVARVLRTAAKATALDWQALLARKRQNTAPACEGAKADVARWWSSPVFGGSAVPRPGKVRYGGGVVHRPQRRGEVPESRGLLDDPVAAH